MKKQNETIYFPWKANKAKFKTSQDIPTLFNFLDLESSISIYDHKNAILGIKIEPKPKMKLPRNLEISMSIDSKNEKKTVSSELLFTEDCQSQTLYPGIFINQINDYLIRVDDKKSSTQSLKVDFSFSFISEKEKKSAQVSRKVQSLKSIIQASSESSESEEKSHKKVEKSSQQEKKSPKKSEENSSDKEETSSDPSSDDKSYSKSQNEAKPKRKQQSDSSSESESSSGLFCGLANQGATCYMNSAIQSLYHIPLFRARVFNLNTGITRQTLLKKPTNDKKQSSKQVLFNLQLLFYQMMNYSKSKSSFKYLSTRKLTDSFGWSRQDVLMQQDVQEFIRTFFDEIDEISKPLNQEKNKNLFSGDDGTITGMFKGKMATTITSESTGDVISRTYEDTYDFSLPVKGIKNIQESLDLFSMKESFESSEKYHGARDALVQTQFAVLPKILHIHLRRFFYSKKLCRVDKLNTYFSFTEMIDLEPYMCEPCEIAKEKKKSKLFRRSQKIDETQADNDEDFTYKGSFKFILCGVIVHEGELSNSGHYYCYFKSLSKDQKLNQWYLFNDTNVQKVTPKEAIDDNFGKDTVNADGSAYILVYVREDAIDEVFNIKDSDYSIPEDVVNFFKTDTNTAKSNLPCSTFDNKETDKTIGFTLITEKCIRANCKQGQAGIDNRALCERVNVPMDKIFNLTGQHIGGLYAAVAMYLHTNLNQIRLWTITSAYEINQLLDPSEFNITEEMKSSQISEIQSRMESIISPRIIFVEQTQFEKTSSLSFITKLYTRDLRSPMIYTGIISCESNEVELKDLSAIYKKKLSSMIADKKGLEEAKFHEYIEIKTSNTSNQATIRKLKSEMTIRGNNIQNGSFLIFTIKNVDLKIIKKLIDNNEKITKTIPMNQHKEIIKYSERMITKCPDDPIDYVTAFTNTTIITLFSYKDNANLGRIEVPSTFTSEQLTEFIHVQFHVDYDPNKEKMLFFGDGPAMRPIERNLLENIKKNIYFLKVDKDFVYSESCYTLMVRFSTNGVSLYSQFNFFIETVSSEAEVNGDVQFESIEDIIETIIAIYQEKETVKLSHKDLRCFWISKENRQIVSDFIFFHSSKKKHQSKTLISENDVVILSRLLRVEIIPKSQQTAMKSLKKSTPSYSMPRLEVYKSYVDDYDGADPVLHVVDFPFILMNIKPNDNVKKLKEKITEFLKMSNDSKSYDNFSVKYASLFVPKFEDNLIAKNGDEIIDYQFNFDVDNILKNDDCITLQKNQPNKLFLVYSRERALFKTNEGVVFH